MRLNLTKNWIAKILSLLLATAIWFLIRDHLGINGESEGKKASLAPAHDENGKVIPRAQPVSEAIPR